MPACWALALQPATQKRGDTSTNAKLSLRRLASQRTFESEGGASSGTGTPRCLCACDLSAGHATYHPRHRLLGPRLFSHPARRRCLTGQAGTVSVALSFLSVKREGSEGPHACPVLISVVTCESKLCSLLGPLSMASPGTGRSRCLCLHVGPWPCYQLLTASPAGSLAC